MTLSVRNVDRNILFSDPANNINKRPPGLPPRKGMLANHPSNDNGERRKGDRDMYRYGDDRLWYGPSEMDNKRSPLTQLPQ
jgi:hypothetical protein